jgi:hypothetical protein
VAHTVVHPDGRREQVGDPPALASVEAVSAAGRPAPADDGALAPVATPAGRLPLGTFVHARSGDKGGDANLGLWVERDSVAAGSTGEELYAARVAWLTGLITPRKVRELVPEAADLDVDVHPLPNLGGVNVVLRGLLGAGVAEGRRFDPQAKALGEWVRSRTVHIPGDLL